jgi:hypothetical protein
MDEPRASRIAWITALLCLAPLLPSLVAWVLDDRTLHGISVWSKPLKFQLSFAIHWITLAWLLSAIHPGALRGRRLLRIVQAGAIASVLEILYITLQASRGRASHYNVETLFEAVMYFGVMGVGAVVIVLSAGWVGVCIWRTPREGISAGLHHGAALGLVGGAVLTLLTTAPLASGVVDGLGHWVGGVRDDAGGLPLLGWSTTGGDLRVPHFFATHWMQALPVTGWLAQRWAPRNSLVWVYAAAMLGLVIVAATMAQALAGRPFLG